MKKEKIVNLGACGMAGFHLCVCGLPMLAAIVGVASPFAGVFSPLVMNILLAAAGLSLAASWILYFRGCKCGKKILLISTFLFITAMSFHFILPAVAPPSGAEAVSCH